MINYYEFVPLPKIILNLIFPQNYVDFVSETGFICVIIKSCAKTIMPIVKCTYSRVNRINRISSRITTVNTVLIGTQTKVKHLFQPITSCQCIRRKVTLPTLTFRFMFDRLIDCHHLALNIYKLCNQNI